MAYFCAPVGRIGNAFLRLSEKKCATVLYMRRSQAASAQSGCNEIGAAVVPSTANLWMVAGGSYLPVLCPPTDVDGER